MHYSILYSFTLGIACAYFAIEGLHLLRVKISHLQNIIGWIFLWWMLMALKDITIPLIGWQDEQVIHSIYFIDGCSAITVAILLMEITSPGWTTFRKTICLSLPFVVFNIMSSIINSNWLDMAYTTFFIAFSLYYLLVSGHIAYRYTQFMKENNSNIDKSSITMLWMAGSILLLLETLWFLTSIIKLPWLDILYYALTLSLWINIVRLSKKVDCLQQLLVIRASMEENSCPIEGESSKNYPFAGQLERIIEQEQLYLNADLSASTLVSLLHTNRTYLSAYFAEVLHTTFYDYINQKRIQLGSVPLINRHPEYTLEHIARASGFNSMSTFRRTFIKEIGITPSTYRSKMMV